MRRVLTVAAATLVACSSLIPYAPRKGMTPAQAMGVVQRTIEQQPGGHVCRAEVTTEKLIVSGAATQILYFEDLWRSDLHSRHSYFVVRFWDNKGHGYRFYVSDLQTAELLIDAVHVLADENRVLAEIPEADRAERVRHIEHQRKVLEMEADISEGPP